MLGVVVCREIITHVNHFNFNCYASNDSPTLNYYLLQWKRLQTDSQKNIQPDFYIKKDIHKGVVRSLRG